MTALAPHPWDALGAPPKPGASYDAPEPSAPRVYHLSFEYEATVAVVNADEFTDDEIGEALREAHAEDIRNWNPPAADNVILGIPIESSAEPDYSVRLVRGTYTIEAETVSQRHDEPAP